MEEIIKLHYVYLGYSLLAAILAIALLKAAGTNMQKIPGRFQNAMEFALDGLRGLFSGALGKGNEEHLPFVMMLFFFILISNFLEFIPGIRSPSAATSITMALGVLSFFYIQAAGIRAHGVWGYVKHFGGTIMWLAPLFFIIEIIGELSKPFSLGMRLFGNVYGEDQILVQVFTAMGHNIALRIGMIPLQVLTNILQCFTNLVQAFIFPLLVSAFIASMASHSDEEEGGHDAPAAA